MPATSIAAVKSPGLLKVVERAKDPRFTFRTLAHLIDEAALTRAYHRLRADAAVGIDGITKEQYGQDLERNIRGLHDRLRTWRWRHQPIRRVHIPKDNGKSRPIGTSSIEDKIVQETLREVLEAIYEPIFQDCSYGFRRGRSAHDALRSLNRVLFRGEVSWILELDVESFFDSVDRKKLSSSITPLRSTPSRCADRRHPPWPTWRNPRLMPCSLCPIAGALKASATTLCSCFSTTPALAQPKLPSSPSAPSRSTPRRRCAEQGQVARGNSRKTP